MASIEKLHSDLLHEVVKHVDSYADYVRLRAVCKGWSLELPKFPKEIKNPWLVLPFDDENAIRRPFYSLGDKKVYPFELSEMRKTRIRGSYDGWLITVGIDGEIQMLNPFTKTQISLPPMSTLPDVIAYDPDKHDKEYTIKERRRGRGAQYSCSKSKSYMQKFYIVKFILSSPPNYEDQGFMAMVIYAQYGKLAYCKLGDKKWTDILAIREKKCQYHDAIFHEGKIYAVNRLGQMHEFDIDVERRGGGMSKVAPPAGLTLGFDLRYLNYLVGTPDGLLMVIRRLHIQGKRFSRNGREIDCFYYKTCGFDIYKLNDKDKDKDEKWSMVNNLGDYVLMLGYSCSVCMLPHSFPDGKGNRIYYTDDWIEFKSFQVEGGYDVGVFNLEDATIHQLFPNSDLIPPVNPHILSPAPLWLVYKAPYGVFFLIIYILK